MNATRRVPGEPSRARQPATTAPSTNPLDVRDAQTVAVHQLAVAPGCTPRFAGDAPGALLVAVVAAIWAASINLVEWAGESGTQRLQCQQPRSRADAYCIYRRLPGPRRRLCRPQLQRAIHRPLARRAASGPPYERHMSRRKLHSPSTTTSHPPALLCVQTDTARGANGNSHGEPRQRTTQTRVRQPSPPCLCWSTQ